MAVQDLFGELRIEGLMSEWIPGTLKFNFTVGSETFECQGTPGEPNPKLYDDANPLFIDIPQPLVNAVMNLMKTQNAPGADELGAGIKILEAAQRQMDRGRTGFTVLAKES